MKGQDFAEKVFQIAYALILLREGGYPCVFYGDYFHIGGKEIIQGKKEVILCYMVWTDLTNTRDEHITIDEDGFAVFPVNGGCVSVWALPEFDL